MTVYYQGEDIDIDIRLFDQDESGAKAPVSIDDLSELMVYAYTTGSFTAKFSKNSKAGFEKMVKIDANTYRCSIKSEQSKRLLPGQCVLEIHPVKDGEAYDGKKNSIGVGYGPVIKQARISEEA